MELLNKYIKESISLLLESKQRSVDIIKKYYNDKYGNMLSTPNFDEEGENQKLVNYVDEYYNKFSAVIKENNLIPLFIIFTLETRELEMDFRDLVEFYKIQYGYLKKYNIKLPNTIDYYTNYKNKGTRNTLFELFDDDIHTLINRNEVIQFAKKYYIKRNTKLKQYMGDKTVFNLIKRIYEFVKGDLDKFKVNKLDRVTNLQEFIEVLELKLEEYDTSSLNNIVKEVKGVKDVIIVHQTNNLLIVQINTEEASKALGCNKTWCISYLDNNHWNTYMGDSISAVQFFVWDYSVPSTDDRTKIAFTYNYSLNEITYAHDREDGSIIPYVESKFSNEFIEGIIDYDSLYKIYPNNLYLSYKLNPTEKNKKLYEIQESLYDTNKFDDEYYEKYKGYFKYIKGDLLRNIILIVSNSMNNTASLNILSEIEIKFNDTGMKHLLISYTWRQSEIDYVKFTTNNFPEVETLTIESLFSLEKPELIKFLINNFSPYLINKFGFDTIDSELFKYLTKDTNGIVYNNIYQGYLPVYIWGQGYDDIKEQLERFMQNKIKELDIYYIKKLKNIDLNKKELNTYYMFTSYRQDYYTDQIEKMQLLYDEVPIIKRDLHDLLLNKDSLGTTVTGLALKYLKLDIDFFKNNYYEISKFYKSIIRDNNLSRYVDAFKTTHDLLRDKMTEDNKKSIINYHNFLLINNNYDSLFDVIEPTFKFFNDEQMKLILDYGKAKSMSVYIKDEKFKNFIKSDKDNEWLYKMSLKEHYDRIKQLIIY